MKKQKVFTKKNSILGECPRCGSKKAVWYKLIGLAGDNKRREFHYWCRCSECKRYEPYPRNKDRYEMLKNLDWFYSKRYREFLEKEQNLKLFD